MDSVPPKCLLSLEATTSLLAGHVRMHVCLPVSPESLSADIPPLAHLPCPLNKYGSKRA